MKPDWDKLMAEFSGSSDRLVGDVDCTAAGKPLCDSNGIKQFPTLKYGDPTKMKEYNGDKDFSSLKDFVVSLGPTCGPGNINLCDEEQAKWIKKFQALSPRDLDAAINHLNTKMKRAKETWEKQKAELNDEYDRAVKAKDDAIVKVKKQTGWEMMVGVLYHHRANKKQEFMW